MVLLISNDFFQKKVMAIFKICVIIFFPTTVLYLQFFCYCYFRNVYKVLSREFVLLRGNITNLFFKRGFAFNDYLCWKSFVESENRNAGKSETRADYHKLRNNVLQKKKYFPRPI